MNAPGTAPECFTGPAIDAGTDAGADAERLVALAADRRRAGQSDAARALLRRAVAADPGHAQAWNNLGAQEQAASDDRAAAAALARAARLRAGYTIALSNLGQVHLAAGSPRRALAAAAAAVATAPDDPVCLTNLGVVLERFAALGQADVLYRRALRVAPDHPEARWNRSLTLLLAGRYAEGWDAHEWRWRARGFESPRRPFPQPRWDGRTRPGRLLVWGEQGVGDEILFASLLPDLIAAGIPCTVECDPRLTVLFARSFPQAEVVARRTPPDPRLTGPQPADPQLAGPAVTHQIPAGSLGGILRRDADDFRRQRPFLHADPERRRALRDRYEAVARGRAIVGIAWRSGNRRLGRHRSIPLAAWEPVLKTPGVLFVSLQAGDCAREMAAARERSGLSLLTDPAVDPVADLDAFAAQVAACDLVLSVANTTVHMAGALGVPAWTLQPEPPDWRWGRAGESGPWYPHVRVLRQAAPGDWDPVLAAAAADLDAWARDRAADAPPSEQAAARFQRGDAAGAVALLRRALAEAPADAGCWNNLGVVLGAQGTLSGAEALFGRAAAIWPGYADALANLGTVREQRGDRAAAEAHYRDALALEPGHGGARQGLARVAPGPRGTVPATLPACRAAVTQTPGDGAAYVHLGVALWRAGDGAGALAAHTRAARLAPGDAGAQGSLGVTRLHGGDLAGAEAAFRRALALRGDDAGVRTNLGQCLLMQGRFAEGWAEMEWRWRSPGFPSPERRFPQAALDGGDGDGGDWAGKRLLVWGEQGIGDEIMFASLIPEVIAAGAGVVVECARRLVPLFRRSFPGAAVVARRDPPDPVLFDPAITHHVAAGSLPRRLRPDRAGFARQRPFLVPDAARRAALRARYADMADGRPIVGIAWRSGNRDLGRLRSAPLDAWGPILSLPGVLFISLQAGETAAALAGVRATLGVSVLHDTSVDPLADLDGFAAQVAACDLVVAIANTTVHMAGALGVPAITLQPAVPDWRWGMTGTRGLWYPDVHVVRQSRPGDWGDAIRQAATLLRQTRKGTVG